MLGQGRSPDGIVKWCREGGVIRSLLLGFILVLAVVFPSHAEKRVALVIGNSDYAHASALPNTRNDALDIGATLERLGFAVTRAPNQGYEGLRRGLQAFGRAAAGADVAVVFYAGHGIEVDKRNYLIPVDAKLASDRDVDFEAVPLDLVLRSVEGARRLRLVILDACRNNPFVSAMQRSGATRSIGRGLARVEPGGETLVAYAAKEGTTADDGAARNSPYTTALLKHLEEPGLEIGMMFRRVRDTVLAATGGRQEPFVYGSLSSEGFYLKPPKATAVPATEPTPGAPAPTPGFDARAVELAFWNSIEKSIKTEAFEAYLAQYPNGTFAALARLRIEDLKETDTAALTPPSQPAEEPVFAVSEMDETYYAVRRSNLRSGPGTEFDKVGRLSPGDEIEVTGKVAGKNWYRIAMEGGKEAFVFASLLTERKPAETQVAVGVYPSSAGRQPGETFKDCPECPEMVVIPAGRFRMGNLSGAGRSYQKTSEKPVHAVTIRAKFAVGMYEVTFDEWDACVADGGCAGHRPGDEGWGRGRRPVINVSWDNAKAYVRWLSGKTGKRYRLLSESEWEYVARAGTTTAYNTGASISKGQAKFGSRDGTVRVGAYSPNAFGLHDVHGNVWEWVEDCWNDGYSGAPVDGSAWLRGDCDVRDLRGGSWYSDPGILYSAHRNLNRSDYRGSDFLGFRVARTLSR